MLVVGVAVFSPTLHRTYFAKWVPIPTLESQIAFRC